VSIGVPFSASNILTPALVAAARKRLPGVRLAITEGVSGVLEGLLTSGRLDLSLLYQREHPARQVEERHLLLEDLYLVTLARPGAKLAPEVTLAEAVRHPFILPGPANTTRQMLERGARNAGVQLEVVAEVDSPWTTRSLVAAGAGASVMSRSALFPEKTRPALAVQRIVRPALSRRLNVCVSRAEAPARAAAQVLELLEETAVALVRRGEWKGATVVDPAR